MVLTDGWKKDIYRYVREADLMDLICIGCPHDEYEDEAKLIIDKIENWDIPSYGFSWCYQTVYDVLIVDVFSYMFGKTFRGTSPHRVAALANSICSRLGISA